MNATEDTLSCDIETRHPPWWRRSIVIPAVVRVRGLEPDRTACERHEVDLPELVQWSRLERRRSVELRHFAPLFEDHDPSRSLILHGRRVFLLVKKNRDSNVAARMCQRAFWQQMQRGTFDVSERYSSRVFMFWFLAILFWPMVAGLLAASMPHLTRTWQMIQGQPWWLALLQILPLPAFVLFAAVFPFWMSRAACGNVHKARFTDAGMILTMRDHTVQDIPWADVVRVKSWTGEKIVLASGETISFEYKPIVKQVIAWHRDHVDPGWRARARRADSAALIRCVIYGEVAAALMYVLMNWTPLFPPVRGAWVASLFVGMPATMYAGTRWWNCRSKKWRQKSRL